MDLDKLANLIDDKNEVVLAEVHIISRDKDGRIFRKTVVIDYEDDGDYQWSTTSKMLG